MNTAKRNGSMIVFVVFVVATVTALALFGGAMLASSLATGADARLRSELRAEACSAVAMAAWMIDGDTNGVDHAREPWAGGFEIGDRQHAALSFWLGPTRLPAAVIRFNQK